MTCRPVQSEKWAVMEVLIVAERDCMKEREAEGLSPRQEGNPPPMSRSENLYPQDRAKSNTSLASLIAFLKSSTSRQPLPTWNETPTTLRDS